MRQEQRGDIIIHEIGVIGKLEVGHHGRHLAGVIDHVRVIRCQPHPVERAVPDEGETLEGQIGQEPDGNRLFRVDIVAEVPGDNHLLEIADS